MMNNKKKLKLEFIGAVIDGDKKRVNELRRIICPPKFDPAAWPYAKLKKAILTDTLPNFESFSFEHLTDDELNDLLQTMGIEV